jgi:hypothetical protein
MTQRLPTPGGDDGSWGDILNSFLEVAHNADGTLQSSSLTQAGGELTSSKGQPSGYASLNSSGLVPSAQLGGGTASSSNYLRGDGTWVTPNGGSSTLASDSDVAIVSPANNQVLTYNTGAGKWENLTAVNSVSLNGGTAQTGAVNIPAVQVAGDIGGTAAAPTVSTSNAVPIATTTGTQSLTNKNLTSGTNTFPTLNQNTTGNAATVTTNANLTGDVTSTGNATTLTSSSNVESIISANSTVASKLSSTTAATTYAPLASPTFTGKVTTPALQVTTGSGTANQVLTSDTSGNATWATPSASGAQALVPTAVKTSAYNAAAGDFIPVDASGGSVVVTLPTAPADKTRVEIKMIATSGSNTVTFNTGGSDVINKAGGVTTGTLSLLNQAIMLQYTASSNIWYVQGDDLPLTQLDARYPQSGAYVATNVSGIVADGATDNYATINSAMTALTGGGKLFLPSGVIAVSQTLVPPAGVTLEGTGGGTAYSVNGGKGTLLVPTSSSTATAIVSLNNAGSGLRSLAVNAYGSSTAKAIVINADSCLLEFVGAQGAFSLNTIDSTSSATNADIRRVVSRAYNQASLAINAQGSDWIGSDVRTLGGVTFNAPGSVWANCHFTQLSGLTLLAIFSGDTLCTGCYFDSVNGSSPTALIEITAGTATLTGCRYFENYAFSGFPMILKTGGVLNLTGGMVATPTLGSSGQFSCLISGAGTWDQITDLLIEATAVPATNGVATLFVSGAGGPAVAKNISYAGTLQKSVPAIDKAISKISTSVTMGVSNAYGAVATVAPDTNVTGFFPAYMVVTWGGTFSSDSCSLQIQATFNDGTTGSAIVPVSAITSAQTNSIGASTIISLFADGKYITSIAAQAKTTQATTSVTCTVYTIAQNII